jgi:hypothetical protein
VCGWEDDLVQTADPDYWGGANKQSLREVQERGGWQDLRADTLKGYSRAPDWRPLQASDCAIEPSRDQAGVHYHEVYYWKIARPAS